MPPQIISPFMEIHIQAISVNWLLWSRSKCGTQTANLLHLFSDHKLSEIDGVSLCLLTLNDVLQSLISRPLFPPWSPGPPPIDLSLSTQAQPGPCPTPIDTIGAPLFFPLPLKLLFRGFFFCPEGGAMAY